MRPAVMNENDRGIPRVVIQDSQVNYEDVKGELFQECKKALGYDASDAVLPQRQQAFLLSVLKRSGIDPLDEKRVSLYKTRQGIKADKIAWRTLLWLTIVCSAVALIHLIIGRWPWEPHVPCDMDGWFPYVFFTLISVAAGAGISFGPGTHSEWKAIDLKGYARPVPEFALSYALAISKIEPKVAFSVLELIKKARVADPFLIAKYGSAEAYIAVWDEPTFEGRSNKLD